MKHDAPVHHSNGAKWLFWMIGIGSLLWLVLRSGANPRRLAYPCQRTALAGGLGLLAHLASLPGIAWLYRGLGRKATPAGVGVLFLAALFTVVLRGGSVPSHATLATVAPPGWTSVAATSNVFVATGVPVPGCSLDGGRLPDAAPCNDEAYALSHVGVDALVDEMENRGDSFYKTARRPSGIVGANDVVVVKINNQWSGEYGSGDGRGRFGSNTDVLKGLVWRMLRHPDGFTGEVVIAENTQGVLDDWDATPANARDRSQSIRDVVDAFQALGHPVSLFSWDRLNERLVRGGSAFADGYPVGEYAHGSQEDAYILLEDPAGTGTDELSYPKFRTGGGALVSMRYGVWDGRDYDADRLTFINLPVLKMHGMAGATISWKNLIGFITIGDAGRRFGNWSRMHDFFWGYTGEVNRGLGLIGRQMALVRAPDLNLVDAIWVANSDNNSGAATRRNILIASVDPFAADWCASEYVLRPVSTRPGDASAARAGMFRDATRVNQNAAEAAWADGSYPYMDLLDACDGDAPCDEEKNQMNVYIVALPDESPASPDAEPTSSDRAPMPDIRANGSDEPISITTNDALTLSLDLDAGARAGDNADWWIVQAGPGGSFCFDAARGSMAAGAFVAHQGPLITIGEVEFLHIPRLDEGSYSFYFGVDMNMNGVLDINQAFYDSVSIIMR